MRLLSTESLVQVDGITNTLTAGDESYHCSVTSHEATAERDPFRSNLSLGRRNVFRRVHNLGSARMALSCPTTPNKR